MSAAVPGSRERLLAAGRQLFSERGFDRTTVRDIGAVAGVDPALIARYFGSKAALYLEALRADTAGAGSGPLPLSTRADAVAILERLVPRGSTPTLWAMIRPHKDADVQASAMALLERRLLAGAVDAATSAERDLPRLRAEVALAAITGVVLSRTSNAFDTLSQADPDDVIELLADIVKILLQS